MAEFRREDPGVYGESKVEITEINMNQEKVILDVAGNKITLYPLKVNLPGSQVKCYAIIEKLFEKQVTMIDLVYGNIDLEGMKRDSTIRRRYMSALSRENIEMFTRKYMGAIPPILGNSFGQLDSSFAIAVASAVKNSAYSEIRTTSIPINNMFQNKESSQPEGKRETSTLKSFIKFATRNNPKAQNKSTSKGLDIPDNINSETTHTVREGILFYPAGATIIKGKVCSKFNYCTKDDETGIRTEVDSFLVSGVNIEKLSYDQYYRKRFIDQICVPSRLKNTRGKLYPYIGCFNEQQRFENDFDIASKVFELREEVDSKIKY